MKRKICFITGTRAEFGLLRILMQEIHSDQDCELQILATGTHLSSEYGFTYKEIEQAGFTINYKVHMLLGSDSVTAISKSVGLGMIGFADAFNFLKPDIVVVLGDRYELISAVSAALIAGIPLAHIHGGETTEGAIDEAIRHSITKMALLHFVAAPDYARRVIQLGETPDRVFPVGGLGVDALKRLKLLSLDQLEESLNFKFGRKNLLITLHPVTIRDRDQSSTFELAELLRALSHLKDTQMIFTMPNADNGGQEMTAMIKDFVILHPNTLFVNSLGQIKYLSCMQFIDCIVGNSSSGLTEAPSMRIGTINIGDRQKGRLSAKSVIHCNADFHSIQNALVKLYDPAFRNNLSTVTNPYGMGGASQRIYQILKKYPLDGLFRKSFFDLPLTSFNSIKIDRLHQV